MQTIADETRKARKVHICALCRREIEPGETYRRQRIVDSGDIWTWVCCGHCDILADLLWRENREMFWDEGLYPELVAEWEPQTVEQARLKIYWKCQWRTKSGQLRPVPTLAAPRPVEDLRPSEAYL